MIRFELLRDKGILVVRPEEVLRVEDFATIAVEVDPYIDAQGGLKGLMVVAPSFLGWKDFESLTEHLKFVRNHHQKIERVAVLTDNHVLKVAQVIANHLAHPDFKLFEPKDEVTALRWLEGKGG